MGFEWLTVFSDSARQLLFELIPQFVSERFGYKLELSCQLRNQVPILKNGKVQGPLISIHVKIRNSGSKPEFIYRCGLDRSYKGSAMSNYSEWDKPLRLEARSLHEVVLQFSQTHDPLIRGVWVENALRKKWYLRKNELQKLNEQLGAVVERNQTRLEEFKKDGHI